MNITSYQSKESESQIYYGKASVRDGFRFENGDEQFYRFMDKKSGFPLTELIHPEDLDEFTEAVSRLEQGAQTMFVRVLSSEDVYRCLYMRLSLNGIRFGEFLSFDIEISEVSALERRYKITQELVEKYRLFMSGYDGVFLEYDYKDDMLQIYEYFNGQARKLFYKNLSQTMTVISETNRLNEKQKEEFFSFCEMIHKGVDCFKASFDGNVLVEYLQGVRFECKCSAFYKDSKRYKMVGLIRYGGQKRPKQSYYLSEYANDPMTGILNKRAINEYAIERIADKESAGGYLVLIDIDDFKQINDKFGHMFGDEVITKSAELFRSAAKTRGMAGRFGGDEFMLILEKVPTEEELRRILKVMVKHAQWNFVEQESFNVSYSMGISKFPENGATYEELFKKADRALYIAKDKGKNRYIIYNEEKHGELVEATESERSVGLKATISDADKYVMISDTVLQLHKRGTEAVPEVLKTMQTYFDIDGIAIYAGADMRRIYSRGNYVNPIENLIFALEDKYLEMFDEHNCYAESVIEHLVKKLPLAYRMNVEQETGKFMQYTALENGKPKAIVSFDFFNRSPKFGITDTGMMGMIGLLLAEVITEYIDEK